MAGLWNFYLEHVRRKSDFQRLDLVRLGMHPNGIIVHGKIGNRPLPQIAAPTRGEKHSLATYDYLYHLPGGG
jgi:hypothetical protein